MAEDGRVQGDPTEVLLRSGGSSYVSLTGDAPAIAPDRATDPVAAAAPPTPAAAPAEPAWRHRLRFVGWLALALAAIAAVLTGTGVAAAADGQFVTGTSLAWTAFGVSIVAVVAGLAAVIVGLGRASGGIAVVVGLLANPLLLTGLLGAASAVVA